ncbi:MAG TPA: hypothetical protein DEH78_22770, partial [Solibacterales bacterium]|nr:hypothetical protein [Bryobacterales bacterium]
MNYLIRAWAAAGLMGAMVAQGQPPTDSIEVLQPRERIEIVVVVLTPDGFQPSRVVRKAGPFLLALENRSGLRENLDLRLETDGASKQELRRLPIDLRRPERGDVLRLLAGKFTLRALGKG